MISRPALQPAKTQKTTFCEDQQHKGVLADSRIRFFAKMKSYHHTFDFTCFPVFGSVYVGWNIGIYVALSQTKVNL
jgi:hypothetical protein